MLLYEGKVFDSEKEMEEAIELKGEGAIVKIHDRPYTSPYAEIFVNGEKVITNEMTNTSIDQLIEWWNDSWWTYYCEREG